MKTIEQLEYRIEDLEQSLEVALEELNEWKTKLSLLGDNPEKVWSVWRRQMYATHKYIRQMVMWREKYKNLSLK